MNQPIPCRWLRFSLRSLFLLVLIVAAYFGGWRSALWTAEREKDAAVRKAVEELQAAQGSEKSRLEIAVVPELDVVIFSGPAKNAERVQRFIEKFPGKFSGNGFGKGASGDAPDSFARPPQAP